MAGWLLLDDGVRVEDSGVVVGVSSYDRFRCRFEALVFYFLREKIRAPNCSRAYFPPMLGDGRNVDLYKLFTVVKGKGGYDAVCNDKLWDLVGEETGVGVSVGSSLKLVYSKYLSALETWMKKVGDGKEASPERGLVENRDEFRRRLMELQTEVKGLLSENEVDGLESNNNGDKEIKNVGGPDSEMPDINETGIGNSCEGGGDAMEVLKEVDVSDVMNRSKSGLLSEGENRGDDDRGSSGLKRKRESVFDLLSWVIGAARNPCDPAVGSIPEKSKWKSYSNQEVWKQVLLFREAVFYKRGFESSNEQHTWQSQKMHPCMYDDHLGTTYNLRERLKRDKKLLIEKLSGSSSDSSAEPEGDSDRTPSPHTEDRAQSAIDRCPKIRIPVGPNHQAAVPVWTGITSESDSKWLGTQIWPLETTNSRLLIERDPIGKGRQDSCGCPVPGSVECVRFHIGEKRARVKLELGVAFYQWNFDIVGEDVRYLWTNDEEKKFKDVVESNPPSSERYFWDHLFTAFPKKSREDLVSYYFNVFLLQRRGYQNRHTPDNIDSDDDESELRNVFGHQTHKSRSSFLLTPKKAQTKGK